MRALYGRALIRRASAPRADWMNGYDCGDQTMVRSAIKEAVGKDALLKPIEEPRVTPAAIEA